MLKTKVFWDCTALFTVNVDGGDYWLVREFGLPRIFANLGRRYNFAFGNVFHSFFMPIIAALSVLINGLPSKLGSQDSWIGIDGYL